MRRLLLASLLSSALSSEESARACQADGSTHPQLTFEYGLASLVVATDAPPPSVPAVPIRGRSMLVNSWRPEFPEHIGEPRNADFPLVANAGTVGNGANASISEYGMAAAALMAERLITHGAVKLSGLPLKDGVDFSTFVDALGWRSVKLGGGGTERTDVTRFVRTASNEPDEHTIEPHMDMAHSIAHPKRIAFFCAAGPPPGAGGETVLTDMRGVYADLSARGIPDMFEAHGGVAYRKRLWSSEHVNHTYTWQQFFFTAELDSAVAEVHERDAAATVDEHGVINFQEVLPAIFAHPTTGEPLWFNGVHTNHRSYYEEAEHVDTSDGSPMHTVFADGTDIPDEVMMAIRVAIWTNSVAMQLTTGDVVVVDNMLASHGRMGWVPGNPRKVLLTHFQ